MATKLFDKDNVDAVEFSADDWEVIEGPDGSRTYTSTSETATATVKFRPPRADQEHDPCKIGSTFKRNKDGSWSISQKT